MQSIDVQLSVFTLVYTYAPRHTPLNNQVATVYQEDFFWTRSVQLLFWTVVSFLQCVKTSYQAAAIYFLLLRQSAATASLNSFSFPRARLTRASLHHVLPGKAWDAANSYAKVAL